MTALKRTALFDMHRRLGARMAPFAGWEMPLWYSSAREEHLAVRQAAGLFDVSHMGVFEVSGRAAAITLDHLTTNDVSTLPIGRAQYTYVLDSNGDVIDDIMLYRVADARYLVVVNAANADKDWAWFTQHSSEGCAWRDLRGTEADQERRADIALQGPRSLDVLCSLLDSAEAETLKALPFTGVMHTNLLGCDVYIARTGYTGERVAYELFVHPQHSVALWEALLQRGSELGVRPCGLAARDSLRIEAGLPLYGHELAGPLNLLPFHIDFDHFVKVNKSADFIGKSAYLARREANTLRSVRFRMNERGVRVAKLGDPVLDRRGRVIGTVTSCAMDGSGMLIGLAVVDVDEAREGNTLFVVALPERLPEPLKPFAPLGSRIPMPEPATVLPRFLSRRTGANSAK
ncbi:MAG: glycine cleavage system aminomethyltransferase GcvT [Thermoflexales bacterium]